ncbi:hypothetical protein DUNSADRAFT_1322 [Dunaliella salina]|uniref:RNB domain-containing protein n=1 Tax=Dunaliella salina TaxID=3046 RepID=A0ABQ7FXL6_DUNSA|nr:hypothetical protein DUNSADRAFT_1322 [Dunaliella salina]|eukprot:KAF5827102.1 hypothetical protein DUNSADRAFT_1322 [Dunaliella salina]
MNMLHDDWGPALDAPVKPSGPPTNEVRAPAPTNTNQQCPLGEDPVYLAALQHAASCSGCDAASPATTTPSSSAWPPSPPVATTPASFPHQGAQSDGSKSKHKGQQRGGPMLASALAAAGGPTDFPLAAAGSSRGGPAAAPSSEAAGAAAKKPGHERVGRGRVGAQKQAAVEAAAAAAAAAAASPLSSSAPATFGAAGKGSRQGAAVSAAGQGALDTRESNRNNASSNLKQGQEQQQQQQQQQQQLLQQRWRQPQQQQQGQSDGASKYSRFPEYLPQEQLQIMFKRGLAFRGRFRVNAGDRNEAYVTIPGLPHDCMVRGERAQNRAMEGDEVAVQLLPASHWFKNYSKLPEGTKENGLDIKDVAPWRDAQNPEQALETVNWALSQAPPKSLRILGQVVAILEPSPRREQLVGVIQADISGRTLGGSLLHRFIPLSPTMPTCVVNATSVRGLSEELLAEAACPPGDDTASRTLISARVVAWGTTNDAPLVELRQSLGQAGEIETETAAILEIEGIRRGEFSPEVEACLPPTPWVGITPEDLQHRRDFRNVRVFSIDPPTAKDLDDAMHVEPVEGTPGRWRVGVHIADVSHFIPPDSALDAEAQERATSVYLVQRVIPMLPRLLCEELCSLNPGTPRFSFSVEWEMDEEGRIYSQWAGKSVICSSAKLAYPMVQAMIEGRFDPADCSAQLYGDQPWDKIVQDCLTLNKIAQALRAARFASGAVRLDNVRVTFGLDKDGNPVSCGQYVQQEANKLVEEFMLLTNISVAKMISAIFPERALLRNHVHPQQNKMDELLALCQANGIHMDISSSGALSASLNNLRETCSDQGVIDAITMMATKPMQLAKYFCTGDFPDPEDWRHYALALPEYTHFTSPIRRYPDLVVHRLLSAAIEVQQQQLLQQQAVSTGPVAQKHRLMDTPRTTQVADHCNEKRLTARNAQDASLKLYLCCLLRRAPVITEAIVTNVGGNRLFDVYLTSYGMSTRIHVEQQGVDLDSQWSDTNRTLTLQLKNIASTSTNDAGAGGADGADAGASSTTANNAAGKQSNGQTRRKGFGNNSQAEKNRQQGGPVMQYGAWLASLPALSNPLSLSPVSFPLKVKLFEHLPVIATSPLQPGKISQIVGISARYPVRRPTLSTLAGIDFSLQAAASTKETRPPVAQHSGGLGSKESSGG